jgi:hypothetical protein
MMLLVARVAEAYGVRTVATDSPLLDGAHWNGTEVAGMVADARGESRPDLVVSVDAPRRVTAWEGHLLELGRLAGKVLVVFVTNPGRRWLRTETSATAVAGVLWGIGRVRERSYVGVARALSADAVVEAPASALVRRTAPLQAFVVDTAPRSPQARRRTRLAVV